VNTFRRNGMTAIMAVVISLCAACAASTDASQSASQGTVRTYYIAADEVNWDYVPTGIDQVTGKPLNADEAPDQTRGPLRIGHIYRKAIYREYTDATFKHLKPRPLSEQYLGMLGPIIHAEVGDTIRVVFKNNASRPYSMHPHGVLYKKASEGVGYNDGRAASEHGGDAVLPGHTFTYEWDVPERAGPGPNDPSSIVWLYHSHVDEMKDTASGLIGAIIVTRRGMARPDGTPKDVDREFVTLFDIVDENQSWYFDHNVQTYTGNPKAVMADATRLQVDPEDANGNFSLFGRGFTDSNLKFTINGFVYGNGPKMVMKEGDHVRWYVVTIGNGLNFHTPHWHGNTVLVAGQRTDVLNIAPAQMITADMMPDNPGTWLFHCHISDHMMGGMSALYTVEPATADP